MKKMFGASLMAAAMVVTSLSIPAAAEEEIAKPEKITLMVDGTFYTEPNYRDEWEKRFEELTGIDLEIIQPDHSSYYDVLSQSFASGEIPDVVLLSSTYYASYASEGLLWDCTDAWENSEAKAGMSEVDQEVEESLRVNGRLYGVTRGRGNGCVTYIKKKWLDNVGLDVPTNYEEFLKVCDAFTNGDPDGNGVDGDTFAISAAGLMGAETPYINYLPEFYQDAFPSFYQKEDGTWADGFTEDSMKEAILRLRDAYQAGYLDKEIITMTTKDVRNKFYEDKFGIFTYWAGKWANNLKVNLEANELDSELVALPPIAEVGSYINRVSVSYAITNKCENPEGVFKYFMEPYFTDVDQQVLWYYGVEGAHWSMAADEVCGVQYEEGQLHGLESKETPGTPYTFDMIGLRVGALPEVLENYPLVAPEDANASQEMFNENSRNDKLVVATDEFSEYNGNLTTLKQQLIANVVVQGADIDAEYAAFEAQGGLDMSEIIVESLNK